MKCRHCGKEYEDSFSYCPYCAEPKPTPVREVSIDERIKKQSRFIWIDGIVMMIISFIPATVFIYGCLVVMLILEAFFASDNPERGWTFDMSWFDFGNVALFAFIISVLFGVIYIIAWFLSPRRDKVIEVQFNNDMKSICPVCGSHSIALGHKGYDWKKGFWYRIFNFKGGHYLAGIDSRRVTAHCQNCGHSWLTNEEWIR